MGVEASTEALCLRVICLPLCHHPFLFQGACLCFSSPVKNKTEPLALSELGRGRGLISSTRNLQCWNLGTVGLLDLGILVPLFLYL